MPRILSTPYDQLMCRDAICSLAEWWPGAVEMGPLGDEPGHGASGTGPRAGRRASHTPAVDEAAQPGDQRRSLGRHRSQDR